MPVRVLVLRTAGTNCDFETANAFELAGGEAERLHAGALFSRARRLDEFHILAFPGGFSYGDDLGAGTVLANQLRARLREDLLRFIESGRLVIGICNGFQILVRLGVLPGLEGNDKTVSLVENASGLFEDRWVRLRAETSNSPFLERGEVLELPVAHKEGRLVVRDRSLLEILRRNGQIACRYAGEGQEKGNAEGDPGYPANPNGSLEAIAGLINPAGNVFGLMPHPERHLRRLHHPNWTRWAAGQARLPESDWRLGDGYRIFERAVKHVKN